MDAEALYQERILALARVARSRPRLDAPSHTGTASNPVCGDRVVVDVDVDMADRIIGLGARVDGCALCEAAAGLMFQEIEGWKFGDAVGLHLPITRWLADEQQDIAVDGQDSFTPVKSFPSRHRCVILPFQALAEAADTG